MPHPSPSPTFADDPVEQAVRDRENYVNAVEQSTFKIHEHPYVKAISGQIEKVTTDVKLAGELYALKDHPLKYYWLGSEFVVILIWAVGRSWLGTRLKERDWGFLARCFVRFWWGLAWLAVMFAGLPYLFFGPKVWTLLQRLGELGWGYLQAYRAGLGH